jgi:hypothetical protein
MKSDVSQAGRNRPSHAAGARANTPPVALGGLVIVWLSFYLVAMAQSWSSNKVRIQLGPRGEPSRLETLIADLGPRAKGLLTLDRVQFLQASPRAVLEQALREAQLDISDADLARVTDQPRPIHLPRQPLYRTIRELIDNPSIGFLLQRNQIRLIDQRNEESPATDSSATQMTWEGVVELTDEPSALFPFPGTGLSLLLSIHPALSMAVWPDPMLRVEIWRGGRRLASGQSAFGPEMKSNLEMVSQGSARVSVEGLREEAGSETDRSAPSFYRARITVEGLEQGEGE